MFNQARKNMGRLVLRIESDRSFYLYAGTPRETQCRVESVRGSLFKIRIVGPSIDKLFNISAAAKTEIMPGIFVSAGTETVNDADYAGWAEVVIEAPRTVKILRDRLRDDS